MNEFVPNSHYYGDLASSEVLKELGRRMLILPVGAVEQHGPHLPLSVDIDIANAVASELAKRLDCYVAPSISYGARSLPQSGGGPSFPGTIAARGTALIEYFSDIFTSYARSGAHSILVVNGHYENEPFLTEALEICRESGRFDKVEIISLSWWSIVTPEFLETVFKGTFPGWHAEHAGLCETSLMLYLRPEVVRSDRPDHFRPPLAGVYLHPIDPAQISERGVLARTSGSSGEVGRLLFTHICDQFEQLARGPHGLKRCN